MIVLLTQVSNSTGDALRYHIWHPAVAGRAWIFICETVSPVRLPCNHLSTNLYKWLSGGSKEDGDRLISVISSTRISSTHTGNPNKENLFTLEVIKHWSRFLGQVVKSPFQRDAQTPPGCGSV